MIPVRPSTMGLSPRRRGNRPRLRPAAWRPGSIPAQAGEPRIRPAGHRHNGVYPRAGGGTLWSWRLYPPDLGLSPRRRGNPRYHSDAEAQSGSIPAQAGEPSLNPVPPYPSRVYPRAGGGTVVATFDQASRQGLSPRRRGNHPCHSIALARLGSIPAQAGEPY